MASEAQEAIARWSSETEGWSFESAAMSASGDNLRDRLASSSEDEKSRTGRKGPRRAEDEGAPSLRDDLTIAGSVTHASC